MCSSTWLRPLITLLRDLVFLKTTVDFFVIVDHVTDSSWVVWHLLISFKRQQSMAHTLPSREFRWSRSHAEDRGRGSFSTCNLPWLPLTFFNGKDPFLANVKVDSQARVRQGKYRRETEPLIPSKTVNHAE